MPSRLGVPTDHIEGMETPTTSHRAMFAPSWQCALPQPHNWKNVCERPSGHDGDHATVKPYRSHEVFAWPDAGPVRSASRASFDDLRT